MLTTSASNTAARADEVPRRTSRRDLLTTTAVASIATTVANVPATVLAAEPDPHPAWAAELAEVIRFQDTPGLIDDDDMPELVDQQSELQHLIFETPARTLAGAWRSSGRWPTSWSLASSPMSGTGRRWRTP